MNVKERLKVMKVVGQYLMLGTGQTIITPPLNSEMSGFIARKGRSISVHDSLWAKALVIDDQHTKIALVIADVIGVDTELVKAVRDQIGQLTAIPPENVIVGATHTHSGPAVFSHGYLGRVERTYQTVLVQKLSEAVVLASQNLEPVELWVGESNCPEVGKNRRKSGGSIDPQVLVVRFESRAGVKALVVNYACHPVVLGPDNLQISADYPFYLRQALESAYPSAQITFINGACGDINTGHSAHSSVTGDFVSSQRTFIEARRLGGILAKQALTASANAIRQTGLPVKISRKIFNLELGPIPSVSQYVDLSAFWSRRARELEAAGQRGYGEVQNARTMVKWAMEMRELQLEGKLAVALPVEAIAFTVGELEWATFPGEFFHELGLQLKEARFPKKVLIVGYSNGNLGYVANMPAYDEGGYEVEESFPFYGLPAKLARGNGERVVAALENILADFTR
jgi:neutral ceramidase